MTSPAPARPGLIPCNTGRTDPAGKGEIPVSLHRLCLQYGSLLNFRELPHTGPVIPVPGIRVFSATKAILLSSLIGYCASETGWSPGLAASLHRQTHSVSDLRAQDSITSQSPTMPSRSSKRRLSPASRRRSGSRVSNRVCQRYRFAYNYPAPEGNFYNGPVVFVPCAPHKWPNV